MNYLYSSNITQRLGLVSPFTRWPKAIVHYALDKSLDQKTSDVVIAAMNYIQNVSCVRFNVKDIWTWHYVLIKPGRACTSKVGFRRESPQKIIVDGSLCSKGSIIHELLHCLGFLHMHTANDRDDYIKINWNNIRDDAKLNFKPFTTRVSMFETEYDYDSITHYSSTAFAKDKKHPTIVPKNPAPNMGQRKEMSAGDIIRLNRMYNCSDFKVPITLKSSTMTPIQFTNGTEIKRVELNQTEDVTLTRRELTVSTEKYEMELNSNNSLTNDDEDDMKLSKDQFNALYSGPGCSSEVGMRHGKQLMNINESLCPRGKIIHELLHSLGLLHMHTANERDNFIKVNWDNIKEQAPVNFKHFAADVSMFSTQYDYGSIMHYSPSEFAINRSIPTLVPLKEVKNMRQHEAMSEGDVIRLNRLYKCQPPFSNFEHSTIENPSTDPTITSTKIGTTTELIVENNEMK
ncbi:CLUMA_CG010324, isoform A [Clunio marinus]|uniref:Metalloendopeptidase n=1 Tax=Clunio marinus TaxID=568069 RepID=A0A1J1I9Q6_9DIPT|nr:CLUMA_CG010324, isoform A [Clunio marinus]